MVTRALESPAMKAVVFREWGPPEVLELVQDHPMPARKAGELLVEVHTTSVNPCDCKTRKGEMPRFQAVFPKVGATGTVWLLGDDVQ